ncbi:beta-adaptin-like protein A isoform X1 [Gossypium hirsutum]|uniref:Beta-adaptin-like protein A isoform X1 n=1 Tax=Gossypium hirsutum TaxID=3635 RepID=A0A1U8K5Z4_GOSHI|nr:beta-adaptin-like protein A isoform X1 [Gossypium hirsutum]
MKMKLTMERKKSLSSSVLKPAPPKASPRLRRLLVKSLLSRVYERIKAPLLTLVRSGSPEQYYAVLSHLHLLVMRAPYVFSSVYKHFYCQYNEPSYVKRLKLEMLTAVANESNSYEIVTELCEYAANVDIPIARESIRAVGKIALQQYDVNAIVDRLLQFLEMEKDYVTAEALVLVKDLLRKYPQWSHDCIAVVGNISSKNLQESKAKAALIWMLGEYSQDMQDAPYVLESLVENWDEEHSAENLSCEDKKRLLSQLIQLSAVSIMAFLTLVGPLMFSFMSFYWILDNFILLFIQFFLD